MSKWHNCVTMKFVEFPFIIYADRSYLQPIPEWNSKCFYNLYKDLDKQCYNRRFLVADLYVQVNAYLPQQLGCHVNERSGKVFQVLFQNEEQIFGEQSSPDPQVCPKSINVMFIQQSK